MKKALTFLTATLLSAGLWADQVVIAWNNLAVNGAEPEAANVITGAAGSPAEGWTIAITGNTTKTWTAGSGKIFFNGDSFRTIKNSNGAQNTVTLPEGLYASQVEFYAVTNDATTKGMLEEFDGAACKDSVHSLKDYDDPTYIMKVMELPKNQFTFTFGGKQVCFIAVVTYSDTEPVVVPTALLSYNLGETGKDLGDAGKVNAITGAAGSLAEGWTIAMAEDALWSGGGRMMYKGTEYKSLKNSNGKQITVTLPIGLYATKVVFYAVTNNSTEVGTLEEFDGENTSDTVFSLNDYTNPTRIEKHLATPKNEFTFIFGGKQVCFIAAVEYTDEESKDPNTGEGMGDVKITTNTVKVIENGQIIIIKNGIRYNVLGAQL